MKVVVLIVLLDDELGQLVELLASSQDGKLLLLLENLTFLLLFSSFLPHEVLRLSVVFERGVLWGESAVFCRCAGVV